MSSRDEALDKRAMHSSDADRVRVLQAQKTRDKGVRMMERSDFWAKASILGMLILPAVYGFAAHSFWLYLAGVGLHALLNFMGWAMGRAPEVLGKKVV